jgi:hypothetical protein
MPTHDRYPGESDEPDRDSDEDVIKSIEKYLNPEPILPKDDEKIIRDFFVRFNVKGAGAAGEEELATLWDRFSQSPSLLKDFSYIMMDVKTELHLSAFPLQVTIDELLEYSAEIQKMDFSPRPWLIDHDVIPNLKRFGFNEAKVRRNAYGEIYDKPRAGEATRFLGWLAGQRFMAGLETKYEEFIEEKGIIRPGVTHLAALCTLEVLNNLDMLKKQQKRRLGNEWTIESESQPRYDDAVMAMEGINNMCMNLFRGQK